MKNLPHHNLIVFLVLQEIFASVLPFKMSTTKSGTSWKIVHMFKLNAWESEYCMVGFIQFQTDTAWRFHLHPNIFLDIIFWGHIILHMFSYLI